MWAPLLALPRQHNAVSPAQWCLKLSTQTQHGTNISAWTYEWKSQSCLLMALKFTFHCTNYQQVPRGKNPLMCQIHWAMNSSLALRNVHFWWVPRCCHWAPGMAAGWAEGGLHPWRARGWAKGHLCPKTVQHLPCDALNAMKSFPHLWSNFHRAVGQCC